MIGTTLVVLIALMFALFGPASSPPTRTIAGTRHGDAGIDAR